MKYCAPQQAKSIYLARRRQAQSKQIHALFFCCMFIGYYCSTVIVMSSPNICNNFAGVTDIIFQLKWLIICSMFYYECNGESFHQQIFVNVLVHLLYRCLLAAAIPNVYRIHICWCESVCYIYFMEMASVTSLIFLLSPPLPLSLTSSHHRFESLVGGFSLRIHAHWRILCV